MSKINEYRTRIAAEAAVDTYINGNISDFKEWLHKADAFGIICAMRYYGANYGELYKILNIIEKYL